MIEEIARVDGYEKIPMDIDSGISSTEQKGSDKLVKQITNSLVGLGFCEAMNYSFAEIKDLDKLHLKYTYKIANPISKENEVLRPSLLTGLMKNFDFNVGQSTTDIKLFEVGKIFDDKGERRVLGILRETPLAPSWPQLCSCLAFAPGPRRPKGGPRGRWLAHCQGFRQGELCEREGKASAGLLQRLLGRTDSAPHGVHQPPRARGSCLQPRTPGG